MPKPQLALPVQWHSIENVPGQEVVVRCEHGWIEYHTRQTNSMIIIADERAFAGLTLVLDVRSEAKAFEKRSWVQARQATPATVDSKWKAVFYILGIV